MLRRLRSGLAARQLTERGRQGLGFASPGALPQNDLEGRCSWRLGGTMKIALVLALGCW